MTHVIYMYLGDINVPVVWHIYGICTLEGGEWELLVMFFAHSFVRLFVRLLAVVWPVVSWRPELKLKLNTCR